VSEGQSFYTRHEHGGHPVHLLDRDEKGRRAVRIDYPTDSDYGGPVIYPSARQMLMALHDGKDPHLPLDRYLRRGKWQQSEGGILLAVWDCEASVGAQQVQQVTRTSTLSQPLSVSPGFSEAVGMRQTPSKSTPKRKSQSFRQTSGPTPSSLDHPLVMTAPAAVPLGIDLDRRGHEVAKIFYKHFGRWVFQYGYDSNDVLQEIYKGILARNNGICPFDVNKSSFGHYVHRVCGCIMANYHRREKRYRGRYRLGVKGYNEQGDWCDQDVAQNTSLREQQVSERGNEVADPTDLLAYVLSPDVPGKRPDGLDDSLLADVLGMMSEGYTQPEMARSVGRPKSLVVRAVRYIRRLALQWGRPGSS